MPETRGDRAERAPVEKCIREPSVARRELLRDRQDVHQQTGVHAHHAGFIGVM
jgi:hypothetical protein